MRGGWISAAEKAFVVGILGLRIYLSELGVDHANAQRKPTTELVFQYARMMGGRPTNSLHSAPLSPVELKRFRFQYEDINQSIVDTSRCYQPRTSFSA